MAAYSLSIAAAVVVSLSSLNVECFAPSTSSQSAASSGTIATLYARKKSPKSSSGGGFGGGFGSSAAAIKKKASRGKSGRSDLISALNDDD